MTVDPGQQSRRTVLRLIAAASAARGFTGAVSAADHQEQVGPDDDIPIAGEFPAGETVGLRKVVEGIPAPTDIEYAEVDGETHHFLVTQTGQIFVGQLDGDDGETDADGEEMGNGEVSREFVFDGVTPGWIGREPEAIEGRENPTLELEPGETYRITWVNGDGQPHNFVILDADDNIIERTEIVSEQGEEQTLEFEATEGMHRYLCEVHAGTMNGRISVEETPSAPDGMELFLDIEDRLLNLGIGELGNYDERGLLSMALHPDFAENRLLYVRYSAPDRHGLGDNHTDVLAEFEADEDVSSADPESERTIMEVGQPQDNHNGGQLAFGPDGYLYTTIGDGGNVHDIGLGHVDDWYDENRGGNAQDTSENLLGGIHRIDVDAEPTEHHATYEGAPDEPAGEEGYAIPDDNPLVDAEEYIDEYYAWGFRNPWGMSIDGDGTMFVTDAGQHRIESVYTVEMGGNYSWNVKEGSHCFSTETPLDPPEDCPDSVAEDLPDPRGGEELRDPIAEYRHNRISEAFIDSSVVTGGHRYEGDALAELAGNFVFANWSSEGVARADGEVLVALAPDDEDDADTWELEELQFAGADDESLNRYVYGVRRDEVGELYVLTNTDFRPFSPTGEIYRIVPEGEGEEVPAPDDPVTVDPVASTVQVREHDEHGEILVGPDEMTLYMFDNDTQGEESSTCRDDCVEAWPPLTVEDDFSTGEDVEADITTFDREDGEIQVAANGWPLYYFFQDEQPGDANGQGVDGFGDFWWVLQPDGSPIRSE